MGIAEIQNLTEQKVNESKTTSEIKNETIKALKKAEEIVNMFSNQPELKKSAQNKYNNLKQSINIALEDDNIITKNELLKIRTELENAVIVSIFNKNINDNWSYNEIRAWISHTNKMYNTAFLSLSSFFDGKHNNIATLTDKQDIENFQKQLIIKLFWAWHEWFDNNWYIMAKSEDKWFYITTENSIKDSIKKESAWNLDRIWYALSNYLKYLDKKWNLNFTYLNENFWLEKTKSIFIYLHDEKNSILASTAAWRKLLKIYRGSKEYVNFFVDDLLNAKSPQELNKKLLITEKLSNDEKIETLKEMEKILKENKEKFKKIFLQPLIDKNIPKEEAEKKAEKIMRIILDNLDVNKLWTAIDAINKFNKENWLNVNNKEALGKWVEVNNANNAYEKVETKQEIDELDTQLEKAKKDWNQKEIKKLEWKIKELEEKAKKINHKIRQNKLVEKVINSASEEDLSDKDAYEKHLEELKSTDEEFKKEYEEISLEKDYVSLKKENIIKDSKNTEEVRKDSENTEKKDQTLWVFNWLDITYSQASSWNFYINFWQEKIEVDSYELNLIDWNEKALENLINFKATLKELGLTKIWAYKENIFTWISNIYWEKFKMNDDYINQKETIIFLKSILNSIWITWFENIYNLDELKNFIKNNNLTQVNWETKKDNKWNSSLEEIFYKKYIQPKQWFDSILFQENIIWII